MPRRSVKNPLFMRSKTDSCERERGEERDHAGCRMEDGGWTQADEGSTKVTEGGGVLHRLLRVLEGGIDSAAHKGRVRAEAHFIRR